MRDITTIGEILIDLTQTGVSAAGIPQFAANPGGAPANVAVAAARLGARTAFIGKTGDDAFGAFLRDVLEKDQVDCSGLLTGQQPTTMAIVSIDRCGERSFQFVRGADCALPPEEIDEGMIVSSKFLHFGSVSLSQGAARDGTIFAARTAKASGVLVSYDPNFRPALWRSEAEAIEWMRMPLPLVDVIKLSLEELPLITGAETPEEGSRLLAAQGIRLVLITLGGEGSFCRWQDQCFTVPGVCVPVADTNGAGDTFLGAVLSQLCRRGENPLEGLRLEELQGILTLANRAAALTCSRSGAIPAMPALDELQ